MRHLKLIHAVILLLAALPLRGQVQVEARLDSVQILIGEQTGLHLEVTADRGQRLLLPSFQDTIVKGVEVLEQSKVDTQWINEGRRMVLREDYLVTSFDSALYYIPGLRVIEDSTVYQSNPMALKVFTIPVDTLNQDAYFGPKGQMEADFVLSDWILLLMCLLALIPLALTAWHLIRRIRDHRPIIRKVKVEPRIPSHQRAIQEIQRIKDENAQIHAPAKVYYTRLTDVLRSYIAERFGFNAMEMTSSEILSSLLSYPDAGALPTLRDLFETSDLVKFAKLVPDASENDTSLLTALSFINRTREVEDPDAAAQPQEITVVEKPSLRSRLILYALLAASLLLLVLSLIYSAIEITGLMS